MKKVECCTGDCQQGRACPAQSTRWPLLCTRCGSLSHYAEDCTRMPAGMGLSQQERDINRVAIAEGVAIFLACTGVALALILFGFLDPMR